MSELLFFIIGTALGSLTGVVLMCLLQSGKQADEEFEQLQRRTEQ